MTDQHHLPLRLRRPRAIPMLLLLTLAATTLLTGCKPYKIEYRRRPAYYDRMVDGPLPDRVVLDDGTIIVYNAKPGDDPLSGAAGGDPNLYQIREEQEDGTVVLRALLPDHVLGNMLACLHRQEYRLMWDQLVSERTKMEYRDRNMGPEQFEAFCTKHRADLAKLLNRMRIGIVSHETVIENVGDGVIECRLWPHVAQLFRFKKLSMVREDFQLKLLMIY